MEPSAHPNANAVALPCAVGSQTTAVIGPLKGDEMSWSLAPVSKSQRTTNASSPKVQIQFNLLLSEPQGTKPLTAAYKRIAIGVDTKIRYARGMAAEG